MQYLYYYKTSSNYQDSSPVESPNVSLILSPKQVIYEDHETFIERYKETYFTIESLEDNNEIGLTQGTQTDTVTFEVSIDNGQTWTSFSTATSTSIVLGTINTNQKMLIRGNNTRINSGSTSTTFDMPIKFTTSKTVNIYGNLLSMLYKDDFATRELGPNLAAVFTFLFASVANNLTCKIVDASNLIIHAPGGTSGSAYYRALFNNCTSLLVAPKELSHITAEYQYASMFSGCTNLITPPRKFTTTSYKQYCFYYMFSNCKSLTYGMDFPDVRVNAQHICNRMYNGCTSLLKTPHLTSLGLYQYCYYNMFYGCTSLEEAIVPSTTLAKACYQSMFSHCTNLRYVECYAENISVTDCLRSWMSEVGNTSDRVFVQNSNIIYPRTTSGILSNWRIKCFDDPDNTIEYIESTGTQFINLNFGFDNTDEVYTRFSVDINEGLDKYIVSPIQWNNNNNRFAMGAHNGYCAGYGASMTGGTRFMPQTQNNGFLHNWQYKNTSFAITDLNLTQDCSSITWGGTTANLRLFYGYNTNTRGKISSYRHIKNGVLVCDLIAIKQDGIGYLFDRVTRTLFGNSGTGEFILGPDI